MNKFSSSYALSLFLILFCSPSIIFAGNEGLNGGGPAEINIVKAYSRLENNLKKCLNDPFFCSPLSRTSPLARTLLDNFSREGNSVDKLKFIKDENFPYYEEESAEKLTAYTAAQVGAPFYFNLKKIYSDKNGIHRPISLKNAAYLLIKMLATHHDSFTYKEIHSLAADMRTLFATSFDHIKYASWSKPILTIARYKKNQLMKSNLYLQLSPGEVINLHQPLLYKLDTMAICDVMERESVLRNPYWSSARNQQYELHISLSTRCWPSAKWQQTHLTLSFDLNENSLRSVKMVLAL